MSRRPFNFRQQGVIPDTSNEEQRSYIFACIQAKEKEFGICVTHLDDKRERVRLAQLKWLLEKLSQHPIPHLLVGDLNALRRSDYTDEKWAEITLQREKANRNLEPPSDEVIQWLENRQYTTLVRFSPTCPHGTRIDYIWQSVTFSLRPQTATTEPFNGSDHSAVVMTFQL
ncbi:MAG: hypothetical protein H0V43_14195 [Gemmatimonadales bacterium]|nr:hypothetical protein [Gemmatimonadales bacterium]